MIVAMKYWLRALLELAFVSRAHSPEFDSSWYGLFTAVAGDLTADSVQADLSEANYSSYARQTLSNAFSSPGGWSSAFNSNDGNTVVQATSILDFQPANGDDPEVILGWFASTSSTRGSGTLLFAEVFDSAVPLDNELDKISLIPRFGIDPENTFDTTGLTD